MDLDTLSEFPEWRKPLDTVEQTKEKEKQEREHLRAKEAFENVYNTEDGKLVFDCLTALCLENMGSITNPNFSIFLQGRHSVFAYISDMLDLTKSEYIRELRKRKQL